MGFFRELLKAFAGITLLHMDEKAKDTEARNEEMESERDELELKLRNFEEKYDIDLDDEDIDLLQDEE